MKDWEIDFLCMFSENMSDEEAIDYLLYSEMGGTEDPTDPWYGTYQSLLKLKEKVLDEEEMS